MKKFILTLLAVATLTMSAGAAEWKIDTAHSSVNFDVKHLVIATVNGKFDKFNATASFDPKDLSNGSVEFTVDVASVDTDNADRDKHLKSADFFDVEKYPNITFKSKNVHDIEGASFKLTGDLTIKDVTKEITFDCVLNGVIQDPWGNTKSGFSAKTSINRMDYNITWSKALETGGLVAGDKVNILLETEWMMQK